GVQQGIYDITLDPAFSSNHFYYVFYTLGSPNHDRVSRFTANSTLTGTVAGSEFVLYEDPQNANAEHHGGAMAFGNDGKFYFTTGEHFTAGDSQLLTTPRGKIHRINKDGTIPTDNPFYDDGNPLVGNCDWIWSYGHRNPFDFCFSPVSDTMYSSENGQNTWDEANVIHRGAFYGWANCEGR